MSVSKSEHINMLEKFCAKLTCKKRKAVDEFVKVVSFSKVEMFFVFLTTREQNV